MPPTESQYPEYSPRLDLSGDILHKVQRDQLDLAMRLAPFTIATGMAVSMIVCFYSWQITAIAYIVALQASILVYGAVGFYACLNWRKAYLNASAATIRTIRRRMIVLAGLAGLTLGSIPVVLFGASDADGKLLIASVASGLIATGICIGFVPAAGLVYSGLIIAGSFAALMIEGETFYLVIGVLLAIYACFIFATMVQISRLASLRAVAQADLDEQREVSGLLLKDFELNSSDWLWMIDADGRIMSPSARFAEVVQTERSVLETSPLAEIIGPKSGAPVKAHNDVLEALHTRKAFNQIKIPMEIGGETRWWCLTGKPLFDRAGRFTGFRGMGSDITLQIEYVDNLDFLANHDVLTKLPNRRRFEELVTEAQSAIGTGQDGSGCAVFLLDLDRFKQINDTFGHAAGDELLKEIGRRLEALSGPELVVARFAGDEFAMLSLTSDMERNARSAAEIVAELQRPFAFENYYLDVGVSLGIATAEKKTTSTEMLRKADVALYSIKDEGGGNFRFYTPSMDRQKEERAHLKGEMQGAIERGEFRLNYQPLVTATGDLYGFEALMRWRHPERGDIAPMQFIALAEETGTILALGEWALRDACRFAASWPDDSLSIAVNISTVQVRHSNLVAIVSKALSDFKLAPNRLELEITETVFLETTTDAANVLVALRELGVRLALDDFGTGYSSLNYLKKLPVDKIKIDRSFIVDLPGVETDVSIVRTIIELARNLGMETIAEGVETFEQQACLTAIGCPQLQGYLFGKPASAATTLDRIEENTERLRLLAVA